MNTDNCLFIQQAPIPYLSSSTLKTRCLHASAHLDLGGRSPEFQALVSKKSWEQWQIVDHHKKRLASRFTHNQSRKQATKVIKRDARFVCSPFRQLLPNQQDCRVSIKLYHWANPKEEVRQT